jgi:hypothetical protein
MNLTDPNVALQYFTGRISGHRIPAEQISGTQVGYVLDNNLTNPAMNPPGTCGVVVPTFSPSVRFGPIVFPGSLIPPGGGLPGPLGPGGTQCIVAFVPPAANSDSGLIGQIINFVGWPAVSGATLPPPNEATPGQTFLNETTGQLNFFNGAQWEATGGSLSSGSLLSIYVAA